MNKKSMKAYFAAIAVGLAAVGAAYQAHAGPMTDYLENKVTDWLFRGQAFTPPATLYFGLNTAACSDSSVGTEATYTGYARTGVAASLANFAGTQSAGSTVASTGTSGTTSNNATITIGGAPTSGPSVVTHFTIWDAVTGGNMLFCNALTVSKTINNGDAAPVFPIAAFTHQIDN